MCLYVVQPIGLIFIIFLDKSQTCLLGGCDLTYSYMDLKLYHVYFVPKYRMLMHNINGIFRILFDSLSYF